MQKKQMLLFSCREYHVNVLWVQLFDYFGNLVLGHESSQGCYVWLKCPESL